MPAPATVRNRRPRTRTLPTAAIPVPSEPTEEQIRQRAYEIYVARGNTAGDPAADWTQAELELRGRMTLLGKP